MKIRPVGVTLFRADGRTDGRTEGRTDGWTDMTLLIVVFRKYVNAPKNCKFFPHRVYVCWIYLRTNSDL